LFNDLVQFYKIGKDLGLKRNEINKIFLFSSERSLLYKILLIFVLALAAVVVVVVIVVVSKNVYPSGALYSSVKIDDFKNKK